MACCTECRQFIGVAGVTDGFYQRQVRDGSVVWYGLDGLAANAVLSGALETAFLAGLGIVAHCSLFESQATAQKRYQLFEEITIATGQPTGVLVERIISHNGASSYTNVGTGAAYDPLADATKTLVKEEDADYELVITKGCDNGTAIEKREWFQTGNTTAVASTIIDVATGIVVIPSATVTWGNYCQPTTHFILTIRCGKVRGSNGIVSADTTSEKLFEVIGQNALTGAPVSYQLYKSDFTTATEGTAAGEYWLNNGCCN